MDVQEKQADAVLRVTRDESVRGHKRIANLRPYLVLLLVWLIGCAYAGSHLMRGWVPHDEGVFAQSADRVLQGEVPHRDYTEIYTGGLTYLHAFAFRCFGDDLATMRMVLFVFFCCWVPVFYWVAWRFVSEWVAGGVTLLAVAWTLPNYSAAVPSWYNLFFATFGTAAVLLYLDKRSARWLFLAGLAGGLSFLAKIAALFYAAAILLFFFYHEQSQSSLQPASEKRRSVSYTCFVALAMMSVPVALAFLVGSRGGVERSVDFVLPSAVLAVLVMIREARWARGPSRERFRTLLAMCIPFALGFLLPIALFLLVYVRADAVEAFVNGVFVLAFRRVSSAMTDPPEIESFIPCLCVAAVLGISTVLRGAARWLLTLLAAVAGAYYLVSSAHNIANYRAAWDTAYWLIPVVVVSGAFLLWPRPARTLPLSNPHADARLFLVLALVSLCGLIQYPFSAPIYFCYVAPLVILAAIGVLASFPAIPRPLLGVTFLWFLLLAVLRVTPPFLSSAGYYYQPDSQTQALNLPRARKLRVDAESADVYQHLISVIQERAGASEIYAGPDCPEVYVLSGHANPTRALFDFFEADYPSYARVLELLERQPIRVVIVNTKPSFSAPFPQEIRDALAQRFPNTERVGKFEVHWRD